MSSRARSKQGHLWTFDPLHFLYLQQTHTHKKHGWAESLCAVGRTQLYNSTSPHIVCGHYPSVFLPDSEDQRKTLVQRHKLRLILADFGLIQYFPRGGNP